MKYPGFKADLGNVSLAFGSNRIEGFQIIPSRFPQKNARHSLQSLATHLTKPTLPHQSPTSSVKKHNLHWNLISIHINTEPHFKLNESCRKLSPVSINHRNTYNICLFQLQTLQKMFHGSIILMKIAERRKKLCYFIREMDKWEKRMLDLKISYFWNTTYCPDAFSFSLLFGNFQEGRRQMTWTKGQTDIAVIFYNCLY